MAVIKCLEISTQHIPESIVHDIFIDFEDLKDEEFGELFTQEYGNGVICWLPRGFTAQDIESADMPGWLGPIVQLAVAQGCTMIDFSEYGEVMDLLETYWDVPEPLVGAV